MKRTILATTGLALALSGCGGGSSTPTVDHAALVHYMKAWAIKKQGATQNVAVSCPGDEPRKAGTTFHCLLRDRGQNVRVTVTVENDKGYMTWATD